MPATEDYLRPIKQMHGWFALSAVVLAGTTFWMMYADYNDEWRVFQRAGLKLRAEQDRESIAAVKLDPAYQTRRQEADAAVKAAKAALADQAAALRAKESSVKREVDHSAAIMRDVRLARAKRDVDRANYNLAVRDNVSIERLSDSQRKFEERQADVDRLEGLHRDQEFIVANIKAELAELTKDRDAADRALKAAESDIVRLEKAVNKIEPSSAFSAAKRAFMHWPIIDGFNSPERITQDWIPQLKIDLGGMAKVSRFDRCRTCHLSIDSIAGGTNPAFPESDKYPQPFASHPRLDLYLTASSPHPLPTFGCTVCHGGQGSGTSFTNASHTPNDPAEMGKWAGQYGWFNNHFWEHPMLPQRFQESSCIRCHVQVDDLGISAKWGASAPKVHRGYQLVKTYGCFGCHEIQGFEGGEQVAVDLRLEPNGAKPDDPYDPTAGKMRKVGPSLRHVAQKSSDGWLRHWTEEPKAFRPSTRMPQFYKLTNQQDAHAAKFNPVELAGISAYLLGRSSEVELLKPKDDYKPDAERGQSLFETKGCLACHSHESFPSQTANFGPELNRMHAKLLPGAAGFHWIYSWIREPERYHPRTKMPNLYLEPEGTGDGYIDPAADIAAFLLKLNTSPAEFKPSAEYDAPAVDDAAVDELISFFLTKLLTRAQIDEFLASGAYPVPADQLKTDEAELAGPSGDLDATEWRKRKLTYIGKKTISRYGCYGCHDVPGYESARPIGVALQDWGRKDRSRLAFEHIHEFLHHHGEPSIGASVKDGGEDVVVGKPHIPGKAPAGRVEQGTVELAIGDVITAVNGNPVKSAGEFEAAIARFDPGSEVPIQFTRAGVSRSAVFKVDGSFAERAEAAVKAKSSGEPTSPELESDLRAAFFYESVSHHDRPGFIWQKLRQPRSYDFKMTETKPYDDRLRMPKFPFSEDDIESIATFVLGLVYDPPAPAYRHNPSGAQGALIRGNQVLEQFNCGGCHMLELPKIELQYRNDLVSLSGPDLGAEIPDAVKLLERLKPFKSAWTGRKSPAKGVEGARELPTIGFHGMVVTAPDPSDPIEDQEYVVESWDSLDIEGQKLAPTSKMIFNAARLDSIGASRGGQYAEWLANRLVETRKAKEKNVGWQMSPPPLAGEGHKAQTGWLYNFLRNPGKLRPMAALRMPRFGMSSEEAMALANYFSARDEAAFPYQLVAEREAAYLNGKNAQFQATWPAKPHDYLSESWKVLNSPLCVKCHSVGGRLPVTTDPNNDIRGPNLQLASDRLRPEWLQLWLYQPKWLTPYTSMPQNFPPGKKVFDDLFDGDPNLQTISLKDALLNYDRLMERDGRTVYEPAGQQAAAPEAPK